MIVRAAPAHVTRGKTAANRLRRIDVFTARYDPWLLRRSDGPWADAWVVDLGYGETPATTLEAAARLRRLNPRLRFLGVEIDRARVAAALPWSDDRTAFRHGGFALPLRTVDGRRETVRLIRAMNVLRQYDAAEVADAHRTLLDHVLPGGIVLEGTSDPTGRLWTANVLRRPADGARSLDGARSSASDSPRIATGNDVHTHAAPAAEAVVFGTNWADGFDPRRFKAVLPKDHIHRVVPGEPIHAFLAAWEHAWRTALAGGDAFGPRWLFRAAADGLRADGFDVDGRRAWLDRGILIWRRTWAS